MFRNDVPSVAVLYKKISKNKLHKNTSFTYELWYSRLIGRRLSIYFTWAFLHTNITPNWITFLSLFPAVIGVLIMAIPTWQAMVIGFLVFNLYIIIDSSDGEVARYRKQTSSFGHYLDGILHIFIYSALYLSLGLNIFYRGGSIWWPVLGILTAWLFTVASFIHHTYPEFNQKNYMELRSKDNGIIYYAINVYNFLRQDLNIYLFLFLMAPLQYAGIISVDLFKIILLGNAILYAAGGIVFDLSKKATQV
jgi:phosphatidylglycerophosphate synthase